MKRSTLDISTLLIAALLTAAACSSLGGDGGGGANLPNRGVVPYEPVELGEDAEPHVLLPEEDRVSFAEPSAIRFDGGIRVFFERRAPDTPTSIWSASSSDGGVNFDAPKQVLDAGDLGLDDEVGLHAPSVALRGETYHMLVEAGDGSGIYVARSSDTASFTGTDTPILTPDGAGESLGIGGPSLVFFGDRAEVYYESRTEPLTEDDPSPRVNLSRASFDLELTELTAREVVFEPAAGCLNTFEKPVPCWDGHAVRSPEVRIATNALGNKVTRLFYTGVNKNRLGVGFAAARPGGAFSRFPFNPVLDTGAGPSNLLADERFLLFYNDGDGIALGLNDRGQVSERF